MTVEYKVKLSDGTVTITQTTDPGDSPDVVAPVGTNVVAASHELHSSFPDKTGGVGNPNVGTGPSTGNGRFDMEHQEEGNWCWAAVSASVDRYFDPQKAASQCTIACKVLNVKDCCYNKDAHNEGAALDEALNAVNRQREAQSGPIEFQQLKSEIDGEMPVCVRIGWTEGGAHFVTLYGYRIWDTGAKTIEVGDPWYGSSTQDFDLFPTYYRGGGKWTDTFLTKK
jgi:hypothetical protein